VQVLPGVADRGAEAKDAPAGVLATPDGGVRLDERNVFRVDVPRAAIVLGALGGRAVDVGLFRFQSSMPYSQVSVLALDDRPLADSRRILVQALTRNENTDMVYRAFRKGLSSLGTGPILIEPSEGTVSWKPLQDATVRVTPLDWHGRRADGDMVLARDAEGRVTLPLAALTAGQALVEIVP
jgi:hypothetical protein